MTIEEFLTSLMPGADAIGWFLDRTVYLHDPERNNRGRFYDSELGLSKPSAARKIFPSRLLWIKIRGRERWLKRMPK